MIQDEIEIITEKMCRINFWMKLKNLKMINAALGPELGELFATHDNPLNEMRGVLSSQNAGLTTQHYLKDKPSATLSAAKYHTLL